MHGQVTGVRWLTPGLVRIALTDDGLDGLVMPDATARLHQRRDRAVGSAVRPGVRPARGAGRPRARGVAGAAPLHRPVLGRRASRAHGGLRRARRRGGRRPWAVAARPGDVLVFEGPSGGYRPDPAADWHLFVGDESALPAIAASLEVVPAGTPAVVRLLCNGAEHEIDLACPGVPGLEWLHRTGGEGDEDLLARAVADLPWLRGRCTRSCTARPARSGRSGDTCSSSAGWTGATCRARPTGAGT